MKKETIVFLMALGMTALLAGGCANKEVVKAEEKPAPTVKQEAPKAPEVVAPKAEPVTPVPEPPKMDEMQAVKAEPVKLSSRNGLL